MLVNEYIIKLAIGSVQFGIDYGINNTVGKVDYNDIGEILSIAKFYNINFIDTARAYGTSEKNLGGFNLDGFNIISKLPLNSIRYFEEFNSSLNNLNQKSVYGYMLHNFSLFESDKNSWSFLKELKELNLVKKIGCSFYYPKELETMLDENLELDIIQIPFNLFDRRFAYLFPICKDRNIEIHTRSTFLQGLFLMEMDKIPHYFNEIKPKIQLLHDIASKYRISILSLALGFVLKNTYINKVVIGIDSSKQFKEIINESYNANISIDGLDDIIETNEKFINPSLWKI